MRKFSMGLGLAMLSLLSLQGCASSGASTGQVSSASSGSGDGEIVTGSRIPRKTPKPSENVVIKEASEKTGL
ncbi:MAG: hypothetical protein IV107_05395 [Paucibacter sp.]|nr:hypothetical protein [Roseateles sp.]